MAEFLITGGAGFIGSNLAEKLTDDPNNSVTVVDNLSTGKISHLGELLLRPNLRYVRADVNDRDDIEGVFYTGNFDYVYHYAAVVGVQRTLQNPISVLQDINGIRNILNLAKTSHVKRVLFASSSEVYGESVEFPQNEEKTPLNARLPYAAVKCVGEACLRSYWQEYNLPFTIFRFFNTYGPRQSADFVVSRFLDAALNNQDILIHGSGEQTRTFCYIDDNIEATINAIADDEAENSVINIGNDTEVTINKLAEKIIEMADSDSRIVHGPPLKEGDMMRRCPDASKMLQLLGRPLTPIDDGLKQVLAYKSANGNNPVV